MDLEEKGLEPAEAEDSGEESRRSSEEDVARQALQPADGVGSEEELMCAAEIPYRISEDNHFRFRSVLTIHRR